MAGHDPPPCSRSAHDQKGKCRTTREFLCSRSARPRKGMNEGQPDCPLCSQSPHDETVVARCAQSRAVRLPSQERVRKGKCDGRSRNPPVAPLEEGCRSKMCSPDGRSKPAPRPLHKALGGRGGVESWRG